jgi:hypothetical protein
LATAWRAKRLMRDNSVMICFTHAGKVDVDFMRSVLIFQRYDWRNRNVLYEPAMLDITGDYMFCRNAIPREFLKHDCAWMWFVDTDHRFPADTLYRLMDAADPVERPIMSALFFTYIADWPHPVPDWFERLEDGQYRTVSQFSAEVQKIDAFGMGCHIVHRSALERIGEANKDDEWAWYGRESIVVNGKPARLGDDLTFGLRCARLSIPIYGHGGVRIDHNKGRRENAETWEVGNDEKVVARTLVRLAAKRAQEAKDATPQREEPRDDRLEHQRNGTERAAT